MKKLKKSVSFNPDLCERIEISKISEHLSFEEVFSSNHNITERAYHDPKNCKIPDCCQETKRLHKWRAIQRIVTMVFFIVILITITCYLEELFKFLESRLNCTKSGKNC